MSHTDYNQFIQIYFKVVQVLNSLKFLKYYIFFWKQIQPQISSSYICPDFLLCLSWTEKRNIFFYCLSRRIWTNFKCKYLCFESNRHKADIVLNNFLGQMAKWQQWNQPNGRATLNSGLRNTGLLLMRLIRCFCAFFFFFWGHWPESFPVNASWLYKVHAASSNKDPTLSAAMTILLPIM